MTAMEISWLISISLTLAAIGGFVALAKSKTDLESKSFDDLFEWIVNDAGELGIRIKSSDRCAFLYKGYFIEYGDPKYDHDDEIQKYRDVYKREFGECCISSLYKNPDFEDNDSYNPWKLLPSKPVAEK